MKKYAMILTILLSLTGCVGNEANVQKVSSSHSIMIDLDKEFKANDGLRDESLTVFSQPIYIGDNDEVSFKGEAIESHSLLITIGNKKPIKFNGAVVKIPTGNLKNGTKIIIEDTNGTMIVDSSVVR